jgi:hypothetical protein
MICAVAPVRPPARHEDLAIVTIEPLPNNVMHFGAVRGVIRDFLQLKKRVAFQDIQPSHLGQALVRFTHTYDRDTMVKRVLVPLIMSMFLSTNIMKKLA